MPTVLSRTFALLNNTKAPHTPPIHRKLLQETITGSQHISIELEEPIEKPSISIWKAAELGDQAALQYYMQHSQIDLLTLLNMRDPDTDCSLLHLVITHSSSSMDSVVRMLLDHGADATARNVYNVQAIHMVALHCPERALPTLQSLLDAKVDPNATDGDGWTPLHYCARFCQPPGPALDLLLSSGADINRRDAAQKTPLFCLLANGDFPETLESLLSLAQLGVLADFLDPSNGKTQRGSLVLQAVKYGRVRSLSLLIRYKALRMVVTKNELVRARGLAKESSEISLLLSELEEAMETDLPEKKTLAHHKLFRKMNQMMKRSKSQQ
ncbi:hypothetical protein G6F56_003004 [Rhizopus delemar]|nr:hypothetical protein G6F56_003004 [Rhizopus delemar]